MDECYINYLHESHKQRCDIEYTYSMFKGESKKVNQEKVGGSVKV